MSIPSPTRASAAGVPLGMLELEVRGVRMPLHEALSAVAFLGPRGLPWVRALPIPLGARDAEAILRAVRERRSQRSAAKLIGRFVAGLDRGLVVRLVLAEHDQSATERAARALCGIVDVPMDPGEALASAVCVGVRVLGDPRLFPDHEGAEPPRALAFLEWRALESRR